MSMTNIVSIYQLSYESINPGDKITLLGFLKPEDIEFLGQTYGLHVNDICTVKQIDLCSEYKPDGTTCRFMSGYKYGQHICHTRGRRVMIHAPKQCEMKTYGLYLCVCRIGNEKGIAFR